jgi:replication factor A1
MGEKPDYFWLRAMVVYIKQENLSYPACPTEKCNKKLILEGEDQWRCEKCDMVHSAPEYRCVPVLTLASVAAADRALHRYILTMNVADASGSLWLNGFNDIGPVVVGRSAGEMEDLKANDQAGFSGQFQKANCRTWNFSIQAKSETFNDVTRVRYNVRRITPIDYVKVGNDLANEIAKYGIS